MYDEIFQPNLNEENYSDIHTKELLRRIKDGDENSLEVIVTENMPLVKSIVKRYMNRGYEYDDLVQLGSIGLIKAAKNYSFDYNVRFSTYAVPLISGEIKRFMRDDGIIKISRTLKENARLVSYAKDALSKRLNREPTVNEISSECNLSPEDVVSALDAARPVASVYDVVAEDKGSEIHLIDRIEDEKNEAEELNKKILLTELLLSLDADDRKIIIMRYFNDMTQNEVAEKLNMSQVQVSRMEKKILQKLKKRAAG